MKKLLNLALTLLLAAALLFAALAVPSPAVNDDAADRYMDQAFGE